MGWAALVTWAVTAGGGFVLLVQWLRHGGMQQGSEPGGRIRPPLILGHFALAAAGLVLWVIYLAADSDALAWVAFGLLLVVALIGFAMFGIWLAQRRGSAPAATAERHFPVSVVGLHGLLAATTLVLVFLTAIGVGEPS